VTEGWPAIKRERLECVRVLDDDTGSVSATMFSVSRLADGAGLVGVGAGREGASAPGASVTATSVTATSVTDLRAGDRILVRVQASGTHLGQQVAAAVSEK
jgi:hypothetical protein